MKKMALFLVVSLVSGTSSAFEDLQSTPKTYAPEHNNRFLSAEATADEYVHDEYTHDEYTHKEDCQSAIDDYDQNVCDGVQSPQLSAAKEMAARVFGAILYRYIVVRELARVYCKELKDIIMQWYNSIVKA